ncbi:hypothetical protein [Micromonospora zamorensis]|uniref:hypothetical protein n=1 Tax=Micromonospora zamorensis TaxID=709883 RepID=UPI0033B89BAB
MTSMPPAAPVPLGHRVADARRQLADLTEDLPLPDRLAFSDGIGMLELVLDRLPETLADLVSAPAANRICALLDQVELCWARTGAVGRRERLALTAALNRRVSDGVRTVDEMLRLVDPDSDPRTRRFRLLVETQQRALSDGADRVDTQLDRLEKALRRHRDNDEQRGLLLAQKLDEHSQRVAALEETLDNRVADLLRQERDTYAGELERAIQLRKEAEHLSAGLRIGRAELWADDGTRARERKQADRWRHVAVGFGVLGLAVLVFGALAHRSHPQWPTMIAWLGITTTATYLMALCLRESAGHRAHERRLGEDQHKLNRIMTAFSDADPARRPDLVELLVKKLIDGDNRPEAVNAAPAEEQSALSALLAYLLAALGAKQPGTAGPGADPRN